MISIRQYWLSRWFPGQPFRSMKRYFREGQHLEYKSIFALRNYFGSEIAFYFAFFCFYTCWLIFPAILGLALCIYLTILEDIETTFLPLYAIIVALWSTVVTERWKRKSSEIAAKFGVLEYASTTIRNPRPQYRGDEYVNIITWNLDKTGGKTTKILAFLVSIPTLFLLLGCCIVVFVGTLFYISIFEGTNFSVSYYIESPLLVAFWVDKWNVNLYPKCCVPKTCKMVCGKRES